VHVKLKVLSPGSLEVQALIVVNSKLWISGSRCWSEIMRFRSAFLHVLVPSLAQHEFTPGSGIEHTLIEGALQLYDQNN